MVGRNDPCPCGSGKKYKKCCERKDAVTVEDLLTDEMENILQTFYDIHPERPDVPAFVEFANTWKSSLNSYLPQEMIETIALDEFFFHQRRDIWDDYLAKQKKKHIRPSILELLDRWSEPRVFVGEVTAVGDTYLTATSILGDETIDLWKESDKPVPVGVHFYCFILSDGTSKGNYLAVSSLIFFPTDHSEAIKQFAKTLADTENPSLKDSIMKFWIALGESGYTGDEFTEFEAGVIESAAEFLKQHNRESQALLEVLEDFLVDEQPKARKKLAIAAGAIRYGLDNKYFEPLDMTLKEIAEAFDVSTSSMSKYAKDLAEYASDKN
ncbi:MULTISPECIES: YecA family protein [unclassified Sporosarcina]|uniref:YecA family protein n=1 Tax=unclassified Sporosarcina TaxID=2647733 RepID=UPI000C16E7DC|nr:MULTISPECIES: SEC-C metal-binding domain-containing protein [unclassified Sporosarcina]PID07044.1 metal-binding protein [Sporosarcina sp. P30]PID10240.1 metal-binding protein [Sporosarcina sp. P31]PID12138.1 metal-binding protein [Sporosarcina sp. P32b]